MKYMVKYVNNEEILYIYLDYRNEFSKNFLEDIKNRTLDISDSVKTFAKEINFKGHKIKIIVSGVLISTISLATMNTKDDMSKEEDQKNIVEEITIDLPINEPILEEIEEPLVVEKVTLDIQYNLLDLNDKKIGEKMDARYIVIHNTANDASAKNEVSWLHNPSNTGYTSFHFAVDEEEVWQAVPTNYNAWHAGDGDGEDSYNRNGIAIEVARSMNDDYSIRDEATKNGAILAAKLMKQYDIPLSNVVTHEHASGKDCPHDILGRYGWNNFIELVEYYYNFI